MRVFGVNAQQAHACQTSQTYFDRCPQTDKLFLDLLVPVVVPRTHTCPRDVAVHDVLCQPSSRTVTVTLELRTEVVIAVSGNRQEGAGQPRGTTSEPRQRDRGPERQIREASQAV